MTLRQVLESLRGAMVAGHDVLAELIDYRDCRLEVMRQELARAKDLLDEMNPEELEVQVSSGRPTLVQAVSVAGQCGVTDIEASNWFYVREASDWLKSTAGGGTTPVGKNWQADLRAYTNTMRNRDVEKSNGYANGHAKPKPETTWQLKTSLEAVEAELGRLEEKSLYDPLTIPQRDLRQRLQERRRELRRKISGIEV